MVSHGCKPGEFIFRRTKRANPNWDGTEIQDDNQDNSLAHRIEHSPVDVQVIGKSLEQNKLKGNFPSKQHYKYQNSQQPAAYFMFLAGYSAGVFP